MKECSDGGSSSHVHVVQIRLRLLQGIIRRIRAVLVHQRGQLIFQVFLQFQLCNGRRIKVLRRETGFELRKPWSCLCSVVKARRRSKTRTRRSTSARNAKGVLRPTVSSATTR